MKSKLPRGAYSQKQRRLSLWSMRGYCELDGRLVEAREEKRVIRALSEHVGAPTVTQRILIKRAARLLIMLGQLERRMIEANSLGDMGGRQVVALHNALRLSLQAIGLERAEKQVPAIADFLKARQGRDAA
jgi:hypothetical protein